MRLSCTTIAECRDGCLGVARRPGVRLEDTVMGVCLDWPFPVRTRAWGNWRLVAQWGNSESKFRCLFVSDSFTAMSNSLPMRSA